MCNAAFVAPIRIEFVSGSSPSNWPKEHRQHLSICVRRFSGRGCHRESKEENGARPFGYPANGYIGTHRSFQRVVHDSSRHGMIKPSVRKFDQPLLSSVRYLKNNEDVITFPNDLNEVSPSFLYIIRKLFTLLFLEIT